MHISITGNLFTFVYPEYNTTSLGYFIAMQSREQCTYETDEKESPQEA